MENVAQSTGRIEFLYQNQMIKSMLERVLYKNKGVLSLEELGRIETKFLDPNRDYNQRIGELTALHSYNNDEMKNYVADKPIQPTFVEPVTVQEQPTFEKQKVLIKTPPKPFNFN